MSDSYEATFRWPHPGASDVIVTGSFDGWSCSHHLTRTPSGYFQGAFGVPWGDTIQYKYIVDGRWTTTDDQPTELDPMGNLNNVLRAPARPATPRSQPPSSPPSPATETPQGKINGFVETARQAMVGMVEALAPGTTVTPAETPVAEKFEPVPASAPKPAPEEPAPASAPAPAPEPAAPEASATEVTAEAVLPSSPAPVAPEVPVTVLPLSTEAPTEATSIPSADVSESKPLETTIVEGSATAETAVEPAPVAAEAKSVAVTANVEDVSLSKPLETTIVEGSATFENAVSAPEPAPAAPSTATEAEEKPSTHTPAGANGVSEGKSETNGAAPEAEKAAPTVNGSNGATTPTAAPATLSKPTTNGTFASPPTTPASPAKSTTTPTASPGSTPAKEKKMRFPSLSSRSLHSRSRSSAESAGELGEGAASPNGKGDGKEKNGHGTVASRLGGTERAKRRTSLFGKLKDVFHHPKPEQSA